MNAAPMTACRRCGTCCTKGGPAFHLEDRELIDSGVIPAGHLVTLRTGERVHDPIRGGLIVLESEMIKIKGIEGSWSCLYFDRTGLSCRIYENRPLECRILQCWDTRDIAARYAHDRLTRCDLLSDIPDLWNLIADHNSRCSHLTLRQLLSSPSTDADAKKAISEMMAYDQSMRALVVEKGGMAPDMLDFIFGRPLSETMRGRISGNRYQVTGIR
jgi:Fe-S-cluster containining protein